MLDDRIRDNLLVTKVDHEIIFDICKSHIPKLKSTLHKIIEKENSQNPKNRL